MTRHTIIQGNALHLPIQDGSVHFICTSPPYAFLKEYRQGTDGQLGDIQDYDVFLESMRVVLCEMERVLVPGGRAALVVGDVCLSRRQYGRHHVLPLPADLQVLSRSCGLDNLTPIRWKKIANIQMEGSTSSVFLGKPNQPGGIIKNDTETIVLLRKPGGYRSPSQDQKDASHISTDDYMDLFCGEWNIPGKVRSVHPAPYPVEIPLRLIRMFSFVGDTVLDPFAGTGTTAEAAFKSGRNSVSVEIDPEYASLSAGRLAC